MKQFEIWWTNLPRPAGRRPVLLLSRTDAYSYLNKFIVAEITTTIRGIPVEVPIGRKEGLAKTCVINCDNLRILGREYFVKRISALPAGRHAELKRAVGYALAWPELMDIGD